ncbi:MAG: DNA/RNA non-specific endonuclease [Chlamydiia bacterium]|nr:DNA/RNA non-specific endonuclease [Chlamydiia bacterium]
MRFCTKHGYSSLASAYTIGYSIRSVSKQPSKSPYPRLPFKLFDVVYDSERRQPKAVIEHFTKHSLGRVSTKRVIWNQDGRVPDSHQASHRDFTGARLYELYRLTKGHLACGANYGGVEDERRETNTFVNCSPQFEKFNSGVWNRLEEHIRQKALQADCVTVVSGPLYIPHKRSDGTYWVEYQVVGDDPTKRPIAVATHFFKALRVSAQDGVEVKAWTIPHTAYDSKTSPLSTYEVPLEKISALSGLMFDRDWYATPDG